MERKAIQSLYQGSIVNRLAAVLAVVCLMAAYCYSQSGIIRPGGRWLDTRGVQIQAHGGGILHVGDEYYWFGEDRSPGNDPDKRYVSCYSSRDLTHWRFRNQVLKLPDPEHLGPKWVLERPKVFYEAKTRHFVMYAHLDNASYKLARVAVAVSDEVDGNYHYLKSFRPLGQESRDIGQFVDDDGSAYLIFESRPTKGFFIAKLTDDDLSIAKEMSFVKAPLEGGALMHYQGLYYVIGSHMTGWSPNPNVYAVSDSLAGPWSEFSNIAPPDVNTYGSQSSLLLKIEGRKGTTVIYMGDIWNPKELWDSRYLWMPLEIRNGKLFLPPPEDWTMDVKNGKATLH
jgi:hypothetical protein